MNHWNNNLLCAIDTETTGLDPEKYDLWQIAIVPLNSNIEPVGIPFNLIIKPDSYDPKNTTNKEKILKAMASGFDPFAAIDLLDDWFNSLNIRPTKYGTPNKIIPLGHNYLFDYQFIVKWLGIDLYNQYFHGHFRDTMLLAAMLNDLHGFRVDPVPYNKVKLSWLATQLGIEQYQAHDALEDARVTAEVYKRMLSRFV